MKCKSIFVIIIISNFFSSCIYQQKDHCLKKEIKILHPNEFKSHYTTEEGPKILLDLRTSSEVFMKGIISDAKHLDGYRSDFKETLLSISKCKAIYLYDTGGSRSTKALDLLNTEGHHKIYELYGGIWAWEKENLPIKKIKKANLPNYYFSKNNPISN